MLNKTTDQLNKGYHLCALHFERSQFMNDLKNKLVHNAVPTAFDVPNPPAKVENARPPPRKRKNPTNEESFKKLKREFY